MLDKISEVRREELKAGNKKRKKRKRRTRKMREKR